MDNRVLAHYGGDVMQANIQPAKRDALIARYATPADPTPASAA
jgi:alkane 1-monooxygenase